MAFTFILAEALVFNILKKLHVWLIFHFTQTMKNTFLQIFFPALHHFPVDLSPCSPVDLSSCFPIGTPVRYRISLCTDLSLVGLSPGFKSLCRFTRYGRSLQLSLSRHSSLSLLAFSPFPCSLSYSLYGYLTTLSFSSVGYSFLCGLWNLDCKLKNPHVRWQILFQNGMLKLGLGKSQKRK
jgi:hypothetical protein